MRCNQPDVFLWTLIARNQGNTTHTILTPQKLKQKYFLQTKQIKTENTPLPLNWDWVFKCFIELHMDF